MVPRPWLDHYDVGVPTTLEPYPGLTLVDYLSATARDEPAHPVLLYKGGAMSAARLERMSNAFAAALVDMGVQRGDRVALLLPNCPQFLVAEFGAWKAGAIVAALDPSHAPDELHTLLSSIKPHVLVALSSQHGRAKDAQAQVGIEHLIVTNIKEHLPRGTRLMFTLFQEGRGGHRVRLANGDRSPDPAGQLPGKSTRRAGRRQPLFPRPVAGPAESPHRGLPGLCRTRAGLSQHARFPPTAAAPGANRRPLRRGGRSLNDVMGQGRSDRRTGPGSKSG